MASAQVVEMSVTNNNPSQDSNHPDDHFQSRYVTPVFKPFSYKNVLDNLRCHLMHTGTFGFVFYGIKICIGIFCIPCTC